MIRRTATKPPSSHSCGERTGRVTSVYATPASMRKLTPDPVAIARRTRNRPVRRVSTIDAFRGNTGVTGSVTGPSLPWE